ncbi:unnamed protein product [Ilex paraguariensis]|uniref:Uncharacterized protein n=1 Tax=Ilex paraguariensis TaxID=185542 RepID=A0ABC8SSM8_9AQUA
MAAWTAAARQAANLARLPKIFVYNQQSHLPNPATRPRRWRATVNVLQFVIVSLAGWGLIFFGVFSATVNVLQFVIVSLAGWGLLFFGGYKLITGGKKEKKEEKVGE